MYRGFKMKSFSITDKVREAKLLQIGEKIYSTDRTKCQKLFTDLLNSDNILDGSAIANSWFPQVESNIFLSHSHSDEKLAKILAGLLYDSFGIKSFIDSSVWGYAGDLVNELNKKHYNVVNNTYQYANTINVVNNVNMMLATALQIMIDKSECLFFLNTPHSIKPIGSITKTQSPWLYFEIGISQTIRKKLPERVLNENERTFSKKEYFEKSMQMEFTVDLSHLNEINFEVLNSWLKGGKDIQGPASLDILYTLSKERQRSDFFYG